MGRHALVRPAARYIVLDSRTGQIVHATSTAHESWKLARTLNEKTVGDPYRVQPFDTDQMDWVSEEILIEHVRSLHTVSAVDPDTILLSADEQALAADQVRKQHR